MALAPPMPFRCFAPEQLLQHPFMPKPGPVRCGDRGGDTACCYLY